MKTTALVAAVGVLALAGAAFGNETKIYDGQGGPLVDNDPVGARFEIFVPDHGAIKDFKEVILMGFNHTWIGDNTIILTHKDTGTSVTIIDRPGVPESTFGNSADFAGDYSFQDGAPLIPNTGSGVLPPGVYGTENSLDAFIGEDKFGVWSLVIIDAAGGDTGTLGGWAMVINNVPAPGALALLGVAGLASRRRRRSA